MNNHLSAALSAVDSYLAANPNFPALDTVRARCRAMVRAYDHVWASQNDKYEVLSVEEFVMGPVVNPATKKPSGYVAAGKIDVMLREKATGRLGIMDHKNLASAIDDDKHEHLLIDTQPLQYALLKFYNGQRVQFALWDCLVKTGHKQRQESSRIVQAARPERVAARKWTSPEGVVYAKGDVIPARQEVRETTPGETPEEFEERLLGIYLEEPTAYFLRKQVPMLGHNIYAHAEELHDWTGFLHSAHVTGKSLRNSGACFEYNRPCRYLGICSGRSDPDDKSQWVQLGPTHAELDLPKGTDPRTVVTNSRMKVFKSCQKKHYFQYELGLRKATEEQDEALYVGSCVHAGLEHYFKSIGGLD